MSRQENMSFRHHPLLHSFCKKTILIFYNIKININWCEYTQNPSQYLILFYVNLRNYPCLSSQLAFIICDFPVVSGSRIIPRILGAPMGPPRCGINLPRDVEEGWASMSRPGRSSCWRVAYYSGDCNARSTHEPGMNNHYIFYSR